MVFLPLVIAIIAAIPACAAKTGEISILKNPDGSGFTMEFSKFKAEDNCQLQFFKGDVLQVEASRENGTVALTISGQKGTEPYDGSDLKPGMFTVTVSETDTYVFRVKGKDATGRIMVKNLGSAK